MAADAKVLEEDTDTGAKRFKYVKTGVNHFSFAFTYAWLAATARGGWRGLSRYIREPKRGRDQIRFLDGGGGIKVVP